VRADDERGPDPWYEKPRTPLDEASPDRERGLL